jgi:hypothetical protein
VKKIFRMKNDSYDNNKLNRRLDALLSTSIFHEHLASRSFLNT